MIELTIQLLTPMSIRDRAYGLKLLSTLLSFFPECVPERYGTFEPIRNKFAVADTDAALKMWGERQFFITERASPEAIMQVGFAARAKAPRHSFVQFLRLQLPDSPDALVKIQEFIKELSGMLVADYAMAHIMTRAELDEWLEWRLGAPTSWPSPSAEELTDRMRRRVEREGYVRVLREAKMMNLYSVHLFRCLPDLYWINVFGPAYVEVFGMERLLRTPADSVEPLQYGGVVLRIGKCLSDSPGAWIEFKSARDNCRTWLDSNIFCNPDARGDHQYRVPHFRGLSPSEVH